MKDLSEFGRRFCASSGTFTLMDDLGKALTTNPDMLFLGGGNPARIPEIEREIKAAIIDRIEQPDGVLQVAGNYQSPQGDPGFRHAVANFLERYHGWPVSAANIGLANGSQAAFFVLFNMFAGDYGVRGHKHILLPMAPEYIGYSSSGLTDDFFVTTKPIIELVGDTQFKYRPDFPAIEQLLAPGHNIGAICLSRPTNPTGNVISDADLARLGELATEHNIPLILDAAYGQPFPGIMFEQASCQWRDNTIYLLSLSKLGMPGVRTGIIVASEEIIGAYTRANTALNLACSSAGPAIAKNWFVSGKLEQMCKEVIQPFYQKSCAQAVELITEACRDLPVRIHVPQGAMFLWLWCEGLPVTSEALYQRLKARGVLVISGHHFFIGSSALDGQGEWSHAHQCLRLSYCQPESVLSAAAQILAEELSTIYG